MTRKPLLKSRTNQTAFGLLAVVLLDYARRKSGVELPDEVALVIESALVGGVVWFRQQVGKAPANEQGKVTPRP